MSIQQEIATPRSAVAKKRTPSQTIAYMATLCSFSIILKAITNAISLTLPTGFALSLAYIGWFISAIVMGPLLGGCTASLSDLLGWLVSPRGDYNFINFFGIFVSTFIFGLIFHLIPKGKIPAFISYAIRIILGAIAFAIVGTLGINTFGLWFMYYSKTEYVVFLYTRLTQLLPLSINVILCISITPALARLKLIWTQTKKNAPNENTTNDFDENSTTSKT